MADWPYDTASWKRLRRLKLSESPLCETCGLRGRKVIAKAVDHVVSIASGGDAFPPLDGLRSLCTSCHSIKTNAMDRKGGKGIAIKGCDEHGLPLDPNHPFLATTHDFTPPQGIPPSRTVAFAHPTGGEGRNAVIFEKCAVKFSNLGQISYDISVGKSLREGR